MASELLYPTSLSDPSSNVAAGAYTDLDTGVSTPSGVTLDSVIDQWTSQVDSTANGNYSFGLTDAPGDFGTFTSIKLEIRARVTSSIVASDTVVYRLDISGSNAPTDIITFDDTDELSGLINRSFTNSAVTPSAADIDSWVVRVYEWAYSQDKSGDSTNIEIDEIELTLTYTPAVATELSAQGVVVMH